MIKMKIKRKVIISLATLMAVCSLGVLANSKEKVLTASAVTTSKYTMTMSGTYYSYQYGSNYTIDETAVTSILYATSMSSGREASFLLYLWGDVASGSEVLPNYGYIASKTVNISTSASATISLYNSSGSKVTSGTSNVSASLSDGTYRVDVNKSGGGGAGYTQWGYEITASSYFRVDSTAPTLTISSTAPTGEFVDNYGFTVTANDSGSGISNLYYRSPSNSMYSSTTSVSKTFTAGMEAGEYKFYAFDNAGNCSTTKIITVSASHTHSYTKTIVSATCTTDGYTEYTCDCGSSYTDNQTSALGHNYKATIISGSCTTGGYTRYKCNRCGSSYTSNSTSALGHNFTNWRVTKSATCTETGIQKGTCSRCSETGTTLIAALEHNYQATVLEATCTTDGYTKNVCSRCSTSYISNNVSAYGHNYVESYLQATCIDKGGIKHLCLRCGNNYLTEEVLPLGHIFLDENVVPTCTTGGCLLHVCARCDYEYKSDEKPALGHSYTSTLIKASTCLETGERNHCCERCLNSYDTEIPATGHTYELIEEYNDGGNIYRAYSCVVCGNSYDEDLGEQYDKVSNYVVYLFEQYSPYMITVFLSMTSVWSVAMGVVIMTAVKNEDKQKAKKMLVNYLIGLVSIFVIVVACPYLVKGIAILVS